MAEESEDKWKNFRVNPEVMKDKWSSFKAAPQKPGWKGVGEDVINFPGRLWDKAYKGASNLGETLPAAGHDINSALEQKPGRALKNLAVGGTQLVNAFMNIPSSIGRYGEEKGVGPEWAQKALQAFHAPKFSEEEYANSLGLGDKQAGDTTWRGVGKHGPLVAAGGPLAFSAANAARAIGDYEDPLTAFAEPYLFAQAMRLPGGAYNYGRSLSQRATANDLAGYYFPRREYYQQNFNRILNEPGIPQSTPMHIPANDLRVLNRHASEYMPRVNEYIHNPTPENLYWANVDLRGLVREVASKGQDALPGSRLAMQAANRVVPDMENLLETTLNAARPDLFQEYMGFRTAYGQEMGSFSAKLRESLRKYEQGRATPNAVLKNAKNTLDEEFLAVHGDEFPGLFRAKHRETWKNVPFVRGALKPTLGELD